MSAEPIITVENLSKRYRLGAAPRHTSLRDTLTHTTRNLLSRLRPQAAPRSTTHHPQSTPSPSAADAATFYALRDVNFSINRGDVVGIDIPWHAPRNADLVLDGAADTPAGLARRVIEAVPVLADAMGPQQRRRAG